MYKARFAVTLLAALAAVGQAGGNESGSGPQAAHPLGGGGSQVLEPVAEPQAATPQRRRTRQVYVCHTSDVATFSDRPCDAVLESRRLVVTLPGPGQAASTAPQIVAASTRPRPSPGPAPRPSPGEDARCTALRDRLARIDSQMRAGYSAREAARLWNRWRDTKAELHARRC